MHTPNSVHSWAPDRSCQAHDPVEVRGAALAQRTAFDHGADRRGELPHGQGLPDTDAQVGADPGEQFLPHVGHPLKPFLEGPTDEDAAAGQLRGQSQNPHAHPQGPVPGLEAGADAGLAAHPGEFAQ